LGGWARRPWRAAIVPQTTHVGQPFKFQRCLHKRHVQNIGGYAKKMYENLYNNSTIAASKYNFYSAANCVRLKLPGRIYAHIIYLYLLFCFRRVITTWLLNFFGNFVPCIFFRILPQSLILKRYKELCIVLIWRTDDRRQSRKYKWARIARLWLAAARLGLMKRWSWARFDFAGSQRYGCLRAQMCTFPPKSMCSTSYRTRACSLNATDRK